MYSFLKEFIKLKDSDTKSAWKNISITAVTNAISFLREIKLTSKNIKMKLTRSGINWTRSINRLKLTAFLI